MLRRQGRDNAAVEPAGKEDTYGDIAHQVFFHRLFKGCPDLSDYGLLFCIRLGLDLRNLVITGKSVFRVVPGSCGEFPDLADVVGKALDFGRKVEDPLWILSVVEGFDSKGIPGEEEEITVGDAKREHAVEPFNGFWPKFLVKMEDHFTVVCRLKNMVFRELVAKGRRVVDTCVRNDRKVPVLAVKGAITLFGIHDGEPAVTNAEIVARYASCCVGSPVSQALHHGMKSYLVTVTPNSE